VHLKSVVDTSIQASTLIFTWVKRPDPEATYNLCLNLKSMLQKSSLKHTLTLNITILATTFTYTELPVP